MQPVTLARCVIFTTVLGFAAAIPATASAGSFEDGLAAYERGDYETALREFRPLAEQGDASAQFNLGVIYSNGLGVPQDSVKWFRLAAEQGLTDAQFRLGTMYTLGWGVPTNKVRAYKWYSLAAAGKHVDAAKSRNRTANRLRARSKRGRSGPRVARHSFIDRWATDTSVCG